MLKKRKNKTLPKPVVFGLKGTELTKEEKKSFRKINPLGFILFERNCKNFKQTKLLVNDLKNLIRHDYPLIMIDQEGGRVSRLKKPYWNEYPSAGYFGKKALRNLTDAKKLVYENSRLIALDLKKLGINVNCAPVLDVKHKFTHNVIGDRSFSSNPRTVSVLAAAFCKGLKSLGIIPVIKHIPGHGPSKVDSHKNTPVVNMDLKSLNEKDFLPFKKLNNEKIAMVAHIIYKKLDAFIAPNSEHILKNIIRKKIRFKGLLLSDDVNMKALKGSIQNKVKIILSSGCDVVLHCNGNINEIKKIQLVLPNISKNSLERLKRMKHLIRS